MPSTVAFVQPSQPTPVIAPETRPDVAEDGKEFQAFGKDGLTFDDILDVINPLHHLPVVGFLYRSITGDTISPASKVAGGTLFGGLIGFAASIADTVLKETSGKDAASHVVALLEDTGEKPPQPGGPKEAFLNATASLRHDANEHDDEFDESGAVGTDVAATNSRAGEVLQTASLRHDGHDNEDGVWEDPDGAPNLEDVAALATNQARNAVRAGPISAAPAAATHPVISGAAAKYGPRAIGNAMPTPQALAANPAMITALRKGQPHNFQPGGNINSDTWLKLMNNVSGSRSGGDPRTGASGLTSATLARALATYGAAQAAAPKANPGLTRP